MAVDSTEHGVAARPEPPGPLGTRFPLGPAVLGRLPSRELVLVLGGTMASLLVYGVFRHLAQVSMVDMIVYRAEGDTVRRGQDLYAMIVPQFHLAATYPPFAALLFVPTAYLPVGLLRSLVTCANLGLLALLVRFSFELVGHPRPQARPMALLAALGLGVWLEPVWTTLRYGQINLLIACLVLYDLTRPDHVRSKGLAIGIAAGLKLTPGVFGVYLLLTGRPRAALVSFAGFLGTVLLGWTALPHASWSFWTHYLYDSHRVGLTQISDNQSLRGAIARLLHQADPGLPWIVAAGLTASAGLGIAVLTVRNRHCVPHAEAWGAVCAALTALLISPISWTHHWVWCVPLLVLLTAEATIEQNRPKGLRHLRWRPLLGGTVAVFVGYTMWLTPHSELRSLHLRLWQQPLASPYAVLGLVLLGAALARVLRRRRADALWALGLPGQRETSALVPSAAANAAGERSR